MTERGDRGEEVRQWQRKLIACGYDLAPYGADGDFGKLTEHRTFQATGRLAHDDKALLRTLPPSLNRITFRKAKHFRSAGRTRIPLVVIHTAEVAEGSNSAEAVASFFAGGSVTASAHACYDNDSIIECVLPWDVAWAAPGANRYGYQCELSGRARQTHAEWRDEFSTLMLQNAAWHLARHVVRYEVPIRFLDDEAFAEFAREPLSHPGGFTEHAIAARVWREYDKWDLPKPKRISTHWDPGPHFPWDKFLQDVSDRSCSVREANRA